MPPPKDPEKRKAWIEHQSEIRIGNKNPSFGTHHTEETRKKISDSKTGQKLCLSDERRRKLSEAFSGENNPNFGGRITSQPEIRKKLIDANLGKWDGENNPNFDGKITRRPEVRKKISETRIRLGIRNTEEWGKIHSDRMTGEKNPNYKDGKSREPYPLTFNPSFKQQIRSDYGNVCFFPECGMTPEENGRELDVHHYDYDKDSLNCVPLCRCHNGVVNANRKEWEEYFEMKVSFYLAC